MHTWYTVAVCCEPPSTAIVDSKRRIYAAFLLLSHAFQQQFQNEAKIIAIASESLRRTAFGTGGLGWVLDKLPKIYRIRCAGIFGRDCSH